MPQPNPFDVSRQAAARRRLDRTVRFRLLVLVSVFAGTFLLAFLGGLL
jgi:hypothetical protein